MPTSPCTSLVIGLRRFHPAERRNRVITELCQTGAALSRLSTWSHTALVWLRNFIGLALRMLCTLPNP
jgi:hypothetical protein